MKMREKRIEKQETYADRRHRVFPGLFVTIACDEKT